jgi:hypothetical protein
MPARCAASAFSLSPPIGSTLPDSVTSPVIAVSARTARQDTSEASAEVIVMPALGPSFGVAPAGTWMWTSCCANQSSGSSGAISARCARTHDSAAWADSRITSPSWPVMESLPEPGIAVASINSTSPPTGVQASPVATPGTAVRRTTSGGKARAPEQLAHARPGDRHLALEAALRDLAGDLAADRADLALEVADPRLARVVADDRPQPGVRERHLGALEPAAIDLPRHEVALGDLKLLLLGVAGERDRLHAVAQRPRDRVERVRRRDEHHVGEIERDVEVVVAERRVLLGSSTSSIARPGRRGSPSPSCRSRRS